MSWTKPRRIGSRPDSQREMASAGFRRKCVKAATASSAFGDNVPADSARTARRGRFVTVVAFRRQTVKVGMPFVPGDWALAFGDGRTSSVCAGILRRNAGESEYRPPEGSG
jgi:hypothetical protein